MATPPRRIIAPFLLAASIAHTAFAQAPGRDVVGAARDLYASARYDEALAVLNDLRPADAANAVSDRKSIEQYRLLCLLALGRGSEAESAIAAVVTADPSYQPNEAEASPRVRTAFSDVRRRLLPEIASARYADAKALFDRKDYPNAAERFRQVVALLNDQDMGGKLPDLRTLASGFLDLAVAAATPPPEPAKPVVAAPAPQTPAPQADPNRIYTMLDREVVAPVVLHQQMPRLTPSMKAQAKERGVVEIVVDEQGRVTNVTIRESVQPMYDSALLSAARDWKYQPATFNGKPVRYRKMLQINISRSE
ncbi:MAG TPA: energy transducer TonB [Vicinamibacterales bacterium]|nr:energy transducer TonB [Vicinamibacterales bacterium]